MAGSMTSDDEEFKDFMDLTMSDVRSARRADASSPGRDDLAPSPLTGNNGSLQANVSKKQQPADGVPTSSYTSSGYRRSSGNENVSAAVQTSTGHAADTVEKRKPILSKGHQVKIADVCIGQVEVTGTDRNAVMAIDGCLEYLAEHAGQSIPEWKETLSGNAIEYPLMAKSAIPFIKEFQAKVESLVTKGTPMNDRNDLVPVGVPAKLSANVRPSAGGAAAEQELLAVDHQRAIEELSMMKALCKHLSRRLITAQGQANHIEWPINMEDDHLVAAISLPNISDEDTAVSFTFSIVWSTDSTWILPIEFVPVIYELYTKHILPDQPDPFEQANLVFLARILGLDVYLPAYSHKLNVDTKVVVEFWNEREVNDKSKPMTYSRITKAAIRLAIAHEIIIKKSFNHLFTVGMKTLRKSTAMTADEAWKIIRSYKRLRPNDASDPRESSSPSSDLIRNEEAFHMATMDTEPDSTSPDHRLTASNAPAPVTSSKRPIYISSDEEGEANSHGNLDSVPKAYMAHGDSATLNKDSSKGKEEHKRRKLNTAT
ncbi:hypothetical protein INS49_011983 [Diaporthe citri]|uniref:uncharacterized protein n=1 Tax=Diaporthe citri TaxID=83186 RepID=UPI001C7F92FB|nr:uncharacterized protein INS49_011983 [Diaporthe citri]KAG6360915.1 hypothetical protein INS49_011983 [Diaporthe citri]